HDADYQEDRHQTDTAAAAVEAEAQAVSPGRACVGPQRTAAPGRFTAAGKVTRLPRGELAPRPPSTPRARHRSGGRKSNYSWRSATIGSTALARRAGM